MGQLGEDAERSQQAEIETPFESTLFDVAQTTQGLYAVGNGGTLVADRGDGWEMILDDGPSTRQNQIRAMDVTAESDNFDGRDETNEGDGNKMKNPDKQQHDERMKDAIDEQQAQSQ